MRLRLFARFRRSARPRPARGTGRAAWAEPRHEASGSGPPTTGRHRRDSGRQEIAGTPQAGRGQREPEASPFSSPVGDVIPRRAGPRRPEPGKGTGYRAGAARAAVRMTSQASPDARPATAPVQQRREATAQDGLPWYEVAHARRAAEGSRDCGELEHLLHREWAEGAAPPAQTVRAIDRLAELPSQIKEILAAGLDAIFVVPGGVPDLDDIDGSGGKWQSDSDEFRRLYGRCLPRLVSYFHRQEGAIGRREFFADAFAAIASRQRPALVDMLGGDTRIALDVMLYFNVRYGI